MPATIVELFRYPVKSMGGESVPTLDLGPRGTIGDRVWAVRDEVRGGIRGAKKIPSLMGLSARFTGEVAAEGSSPAEITAPDGEVRTTGAPDINDWLSDKLGHAVTLWPLLPPDRLDHYRRVVDNPDFEGELRAVFARTPEEPLPDLSMFAEVVEYESPPGTYFDAYPILIMSVQSLRSMAAHRPASEFDVRRFRPNVLVDFGDGADGFPEEAWTGTTIRLGSAELDVVGACPRCVMTTHGFADLPRDPGIMRALVQANQGNLGVYARVGRTGSARTGDSVSVAA